MRLLIIFTFAFVELFAQLQTPLEKSNYSKLTSSKELLEYVQIVSQNSEIFTLDTLAVSPKGNIVPYLKISSKQFEKSKNKLKVMIFAQQHGNEHSGKEALLLFLKELTLDKHKKILEKLELIIIPQLNPDGNDLDKRRNGNDIDLNRNHLILTEPETIGLHKVFREKLPHLTIDIHEYNPFTKEWTDYGYHKRFDEQIGILTNPNVDKKIRELQKQDYLPFIFKYLADQGFSSTEYIVGGPPNKERIRYSTVDINDGRQSFGILSTFSLIFEGINGKTSIDNIERRSLGQLNAILGTLEYASQNSFKIIKLVDQARKQNISYKGNVVLQMEHIFEREQELKLFSLKSQKDTVLMVSDKHTKVKSLFEKKMPFGFLIPKSHQELLLLIQKHGIVYKEYSKSSRDIIYEYEILGHEKKQIEDREVIIPIIDKQKIKLTEEKNYLLIPIQQLHSLKLMLMLEPESMINILQYEQFTFLLKENTKYPILRIEKN